MQWRLVRASTPAASRLLVEAVATPTRTQDQSDRAGLLRQRQALVQQTRVGPPRSCIWGARALAPKAIGTSECDRLALVIFAAGLPLAAFLRRREARKRRSQDKGTDD